MDWRRTAAIAAFSALPALAMANADLEKQIANSKNWAMQAGDMFNQRYSQLEPGSPYDREALLAFQTELQNTPHFGSVIVDIERDPALSAAVPVRVRL